MPLRYQFESSRRSYSRRSYSICWGPLQFN